MKKNNHHTILVESHDHPLVRRPKKLEVWLYVLNRPEGVSEKPLNAATRVVSGRNYLTELERKYDVKLVKKRLRKTSTDGSKYSVYQLLDRAQAHKLVSLIIDCYSRHKLEPESLAHLADRFPNRKEAT